VVKTIAVDFDGDEPAPGSKEAMQKLLDAGYEVVIYSTRCYEMKAWLDKHQIPYTRVHDEPNKPLCVLFIDDNAYRFRGNWGGAMGEIMKILQGVA
jgi:hypothetical protein